MATPGRGPVSEPVGVILSQRCGHLRVVSMAEWYDVLGLSGVLSHVLGASAMTQLCRLGVVHLVIQTRSSFADVDAS